MVNNISFNEVLVLVIGALNCTPVGKVYLGMLNMRCTLVGQ